MTLLILLACAPSQDSGSADSGTPSSSGGSTHSDGGSDGGSSGPTCQDQDDDEHVFVSSRADWQLLAVGSQHSCGLQASTGQVLCWGYDWYGQLAVPELSSSVRDLVAGGRYSCALLDDGSVSCWGEAGPVLDDIPQTTFQSLEGGYDFVCGLDSSGMATCWGDDEHQQTQVQGGPFIDLSTGRAHTCGVQQDNSLVCWGGIDAPPKETKPAPPPHEGEIVAFGQTDAPAGSWTKVDAGDFHTCAVDPEGQTTCWGRDRAGELDAPLVPMQAVAAGGAHSCGLDSDGAVCCWGGDGAAWGYGQVAQPQGPFSWIDAVSVYTCGLRGTAAPFEALCWGALGDLPVQVP